MHILGRLFNLEGETISSFIIVGSRDPLCPEVKQAVSMEINFGRGLQNGLHVYVVLWIEICICTKR